MFDYDRNFTRDRLLAEYKHIYEFEIQRKDNFGSKQSLAIAIITLVIGAMTAMATSLPHTTSICRQFLYGVMCLTYLCLGVSLTYLFLAIKARAYSYLANISRIDEAIRAMHQKKLSPENMAHEFNKFLVNRYRQAASNNRTQNIKKSSLFVRTITWLCASVVFLFIGVGLFAACSLKAGEPISKTQIVDSSIQIHPDNTLSITVTDIGVNTMCDDEKTPKEEPIPWPENEKINENQEAPSKETRTEE